MGQAPARPGGGRGSVGVAAMRKSIHVGLLALLLLLFSCGKDNPPEPGRQHTPAVTELISLMESNPGVKALLENSISQAAAVNPDRRYNPAQSLDEFYEFVDWNVRQLPWDVMITASPTEYGQSLYGRADQGIGYFWFIVDQPLDELKDRGYYYPTVEFVEPFASWLTTYASSWGDWLSTPESWNSSYYKIVASDPDWGLSKGWYEDPSAWHSFNDFFARRLSSPSVRPVADTDVVAPADSWPKELWTIGEDNHLVYPSDLQIKTAKLSDIGALIGDGSAYRDAFAGGTLTHTFLDVNDYHRYHSPVSGTLRELRTIPGIAAGGGYTLWDDEKKLYYYNNDMGFQMVETRSCAIIETPGQGLVAVMPVGMSQICSCNWLPTLKVGEHIERGQEMGYFLFGGSDIVMLFQKGVDVELLHDGNHLLMGQAYARLGTKNDKSETMEIQVSDGTRSVTFELNNSPVAKSLFDQLPITVAVENYGSNEKIFYPGDALSASGGMEGDCPEGTLAYFSPWGNVVMYYGAASRYPGLYILGTASEGKDQIKDLSGTITVSKR